MKKKVISAALLATLIAAGASAQKVAYPADKCADYVYENKVNPDASWHKSRKGMLMTGEAGSVRAMSPFSWGKESAKRYADVVNLYNETFDDGVRVYCMPIPLAIAYYCPDEAKSMEGRQHDAIKSIFSGLDEDVVRVDIYPVLGEHASEPIYSRTDHHWAPLGGYYAAAQLADAAGVPFIPLSDYEAVEIEGYVGTMPSFSGDPTLKNSPETFVYYKPKDVDVTTTYTTYRLDKARKNVVGVEPSKTGEFFLKFKGASTYCTFMGGDSKLVKVETPTKNGRHLLIIKDSFGNALPGYLFGSFEEIHVVDCRYFTENMVDYVRNNGITDIVFANNLGHATMKRTTDVVSHYLEQK